MTVGRDPEDAGMPNARRGRRKDARKGASAGPLALAAAVVLAVPLVVATDPVLRVGTADAASPRAKPATGATATARPAKDSASGGAAGELYWVQVGAFRDPDAAKRVAQKLRELKYQVNEATIPGRSSAAVARPAAGVATEAREVRKVRDRYEVVVAGASADVEATLIAKGLTSRTATEGAVITPGLPLGEAVALSQDLTRDGLAVRVQRVEAAAEAAPRSESAPRSEGAGRAGDPILHRVRVGGFADRAAAEAALKELSARGYEPVLTRGSE